MASASTRASRLLNLTKSGLSGRNLKHASLFFCIHPPPVYLPPNFNRILSCLYHLEDNTIPMGIVLLYQIIYWIQNLATNAISFGSYTIQNTTYLRHPKIIILQVQMSLRMIKKGLLFYAEFLQ